MSTWNPFPTSRRLLMRALLSMPPANVGELSRMRTQLSGKAVDLTALEALLTREPGFASRCFSRIIPSVFTHARNLLDGAPHALTVHTPGTATVTEIPRAEVAGWVAHMFLGTLAPPSAAHPDVDFARLLMGSAESTAAKLRCVLAYFDRIADGAPKGRFAVDRRVVPPRTTFEWLGDASPLTDVTVDASGTIEDAGGHLQVDFANAYLGGGVLRRGCVQEEIRFSVAPEHLAAMIVSPRMRDDEAIVMRGAARFCRTRGYASTLTYAGSFDDPTPCAPDGTPDVAFVAVDAVDYRTGEVAKQFGEAAMLRELNKARAGWRRDARQQPVATGNWGCGAFLGDPPLKAVLQWIAASAEGRALRYCTFGDARVGDLAGFAATVRARGLTAGVLWRRLLTAADPADTAGLYARLLA